MEQASLVSLIIPVHNAEAYLEETLQSVLDQTLPRGQIEVIAVDDASVDRSRAILRGFADKHGNTCILELAQCSGAAGRPRNLGMAQASGVYLQFLDDDDLLVPEACERLVNAIETEKSNIVCGRFEVAGLAGPRVPEIFDLALAVPLHGVNAEDHPEVFAPPPAVWSRIFRRDFINSLTIRFPEGVIAQDSVFVAEALLRANTISTINDTVCHYRVRTDGQNPSMSGRLDLRLFQDNILTRKMIEQLFRSYSRLDYYDVLYEQHLRYLLGRAMAAFVQDGEDILDILETISPFFEHFDRMDLKFEEPVARLLIELIGSQMYKECVEIIDLLQSRGLLRTNAQ